MCEVAARLRDRRSSGAGTENPLSTRLGERPIEGLPTRRASVAFVASALAGLAIGFTYGAMPGFIVRAVASTETGSATGFYQVARSIGLTLGSAVSAAVLTANTRAGQAIPEVDEFRDTLLIAAGGCAATALISFVLSPPVGRPTGGGPKGCSNRKSWKRLAPRNLPDCLDRIPGDPRRGRQDMATWMGSSNSKRRESSSPRGVVRLAVGIAATVILGAGAVAAVTLPFSVSASAMSASSGTSLVIKTEHVPKVGTVLATSSGLTLYRYTVDPAGKATCTGVCAKVWPPLLLPKGVTRIKAPHGVKGLSAIRVAGGHLQVFFHREALYVFASDTKKGQATGQGIEGTWFAVLSDDKSSAPASTTTTTSPGATATTATVPPTAPPNTVPVPKTSNSSPATATTTPKPSVTTPPVTTPPVTTPPPTTTTQPPTTTTTSGYGY